MKAMLIADAGPRGRLAAGDVDDPVAAPDGVVIRAESAGVNRADLLQRAGRYGSPPGWPAWPGLECAGTIEAVGADVRTWSVGDRVVALVGGGAYAEAVACPADLVLAAPASLTAREAGGVMEASCTVWSALDSARARHGETVLVHGGSGGIGTFAIQLAVAQGLRVVATAGGPERAARCAELGADVVIDHRAQDFVEIVAALGGADVILDVMGAAYLSRNLAALAPDGRLVSLGLQGGATSQIDLGALLSRRATVIGTTLRGRPHSQRAAIVASVGREVWPLLGSHVRPVIAGAYPLGEAEQALRALAAGEVFGKLVLEP